MVLFHRDRSSSIQDVTVVTRRTTIAAGSSRRMRRPQKPRRSVTERGRASMRCVVIRKPEMAKKMSTPTKPPRSSAGMR